MSKKNKTSRRTLERELAAAKAEIERLNSLIDTAQVEDFLEAVPLEAAHQVKRWGVEHDAGKEPQDWFWALGYLSGKGLRAAIDGDIEKAKHHTISSAALMLNWHRHLSGTETTFRPGIEPPAETTEAPSECLGNPDEPEIPEPYGAEGVAAYNRKAGEGTP